VPGPEVLPASIGRYQVVELIGRGAMGVVYKGRDPLLDRIVAIKTINAPASLGERVRKAFLERFEREAKAAAGISHPAIVTIFDVGLELENPFLVMEYLPGETLADRLDRGRIPLPQAFECARELALALGRAHRQRIVHRDVKPANVLDAGDGRWKLADFGIARLPDSDLTQLGTFMGTPGYSPPEAIREWRYTAQADVFAWGALLYELICGHIPYEGPDTETTNKKVLAAEPPSPLTYDPRVPPALARVAMRALAHDPSVRYRDGTHVAQALVEAWQETINSGIVPVSMFATSVPLPPVDSIPPPPPPKKGSAAAAAAAKPVAAAPPLPAPMAVPAPLPQPKPAPRPSRELATDIDPSPRGARREPSEHPERATRPLRPAQMLSDPARSTPASGSTPPIVRPLHSTAREEVQVIRTSTEIPAPSGTSRRMSRAAALAILALFVTLIIVLVVWLSR
jgi:serine/threonine protein kinase